MGFFEADICSICDETFDHLSVVAIIEVISSSDLEGFALPWRDGESGFFGGHENSTRYREWEDSRV